MGRRGRPPGASEPGHESALPHETERTGPQQPEPQQPEPFDAPATRQMPAQPSVEQAPPADEPSPPTFEEIFETSADDAEPVATPASTQPERRSEPSAVDAIADAIGTSSSQTPWASSATTSASAPQERAVGPDTQARASKQAGASRQVRASKQAGPRRRRVVGGIVIAVVIVAILGGVLGGGWALFGPAIVDRFSEAEDFEGAGSGEIVVRIEQGWTGAQVAAMLEEEGVIADQEAFYDLIVADSSIGFQSGSYRLALEMSSQAALDALQDAENRIVLQVTIPEGFVLQQVFARLSEQTGVPEADLVQAAGDPAAYGVSASTLEGWLFPATYTFDDGATAQQMLQTMVDRMRQALTDRDVPEDQWQRIVTFASLVEREGGPVENFGQVARVFQNRLDIGMRMQSDATVHYGIGDFGVITTTDEQRADAGNPYNTYVHSGLPVGPIGAPGDAAIDAVLAPPAGDWLYFVTIDPSTGETVFSETLAQHNQAVLLFQAWLRENPEYGS